jgi:peroxiredoxin
MKHHKRSAVGALIAAVGLGLSLLYAPAGLAIGAVAFVICFGAVRIVNDPITRSLFQLSALLYAAAVYLASQSWLLAAATLAYPLLAPGDLAIRKAGFYAVWLWPVAALVGIGLLLAAWPPTLWWIAALPPVLYALYVSKYSIGLIRRFRDQNRSSWSVERGADVPDFMLPIRGGDETFRLSAERGHHVLIQFTRGDWCPVCHVVMRLLKKEAHRLSDGRVKVVLISPSSGEEADEFVADLKLPFAVLCDPEHVVAKLFGALDEAAYDGAGAPVAATFIVGPAGQLLHNSQAENVASFLEPREVLRLLGAQ